jgi:hypothetical protein
VTVTQTPNAHQRLRLRTSAPNADAAACRHAEAEPEEAQRLTGIVPKFNAVLIGQAVPLDKAQKAQLAVRGQSTHSAC